MANHGAPHTLIVDNAGGHLMQHGLVDLVIVGTDRTTANGDVCNKIGTYLKALAAHDNGVPFYVALPSPTIDWTVHDGVKEIPIEERSADEVNFVQGRGDDGAIMRVQDRAGRRPRRQSRRSTSRRRGWSPASSPSAASPKPRRRDSRRCSRSAPERARVSVLDRGAVYEFDAGGSE